MLVTLALFLRPPMPIKEVKVSKSSPYASESLVPLRHFLVRAQKLTFAALDANVCDAERTNARV